jgi:hypothetical protein
VAARPEKHLGITQGKRETTGATPVRLHQIGDIMPTDKKKTVKDRRSAIPPRALPRRGKTKARKVPKPVARGARKR